MAIAVLSAVVRLASNQSSTAATETAAALRLQAPLDLFERFDAAGVHHQ